MSLPSVRHNVGAPFPALVKGGGPVKISKQNGIWTVQLTPTGLGPMPLNANPTLVQVIVFNTQTQTWQVTTLAGLQSGGLAITNVTAAMSPYTPLITDFFLAVDTTGGPVEIDLPATANRGGVALSIKDVKNNAAVNNITIKPVAAPAETIDGHTNAAPLVIKANYGGVRLLPIAANNLWTIAP